VCSSILRKSRESEQTNSSPVCHRVLSTTFETKPGRRTYVLAGIRTGSPSQWQASSASSTDKRSSRSGLLLAVLKGERIDPIVRILWGTGLRRAELLGLDWDDVQLEDASPYLLVPRQHTRLWVKMRGPPRAIERIFAEVLPQDKADGVCQLQTEGRGRRRRTFTAMVGDG